MRDPQHSERERENPRLTAEALVAGGHQQLDTAGGQDTLLHAEALLVVTAGDLEHVPLELLERPKQRKGA